MQDLRVEERSSGDVRDTILSQHVVLRELLTETVQTADRVATSCAELDALRGRAKALYDALSMHMHFEEQMLPAALRDVIGWGAVIQDKLEDDHVRQRESLALAISAIGSTGLSGAEIIANVRSFATTLLVDMETEEECLLQADLDAIASDVKGG